MSATAAHFEGIASLVKRRDASVADLGLQTILLFGNPGTGKTSLAAAFPNHLYLDLEASATNHDIDQLQLTTWASIRDFIEQAHTAGPSFLGDRKTLIIDTVTDLWNLCAKHELAQLFPTIKNPTWPEDFGRTLSAVRNEFKRVLQQLLDLHNKGIMGTIFIAHEEAEAVKTLTGEYHIRRPLVNDKDIKGWVAAKPQMVLRTFTADAHPVTDEPFAGGTKYLLQTAPLRAGDVVKDRTRRLPPFMGADYNVLLAQYNKTTDKES